LWLVNLLDPVNTTTFLLLFIRISSFFSFLPFFNYMTIPMNVKAALALWLTIVLYPLTPKVTFDINVVNIGIAVLLEGMFAFVVGSALMLIFDILRYAAEQVSFVMGFTMASVFDPNFGAQSTIVAQFFIWVAMLLFLGFGGDHIEIAFIAKALSQLPFGAVFNYDSVYKFFVDYMYKYFLLGVAFAFPIIAISLMSDIIFGMIMKTMPQFNLLVIGFPIKIFVSFLVLMAILSSMMIMWKKEMLHVFNLILGFF